MLPYGSIIGVGGLGHPAVLQEAEDLFDEMQKDRRSRFVCGGKHVTIIICNGRVVSKMDRLHGPTS